MSDDRRIALAEAGRRPVMVVLCKPKLSGCRRGSVRNPGDPSTVSMLRRSPCCSSRQHTSGCHGNQPSWHVRQGQQSSDWSGCGSEREDRNTATTVISLFRLAPPVSFAATALLRVSELHDMLVAAVVPSTKVVTDLFPLTHQRTGVGHSARSKKTGACPSPLRSAFGVAGPWPAAR
jgi:hypothetical protein